MEKKSKTFSHSKLSTFEQCKQKYKFRYIDKIIPEIEKSIESVLGSSVHETLEWLYTKVKENIIPTLDDTIVNYTESWQKNFSPLILIVKKELTEKDYFNKGINFLINYYTKHQPFNDNTLELEKKISLELGENQEYKIQGFIDRLAYNLETKQYEIHDYKTANSIPSKEKIENDRQLALYSIAIKNEFGKDKDICLIWHYLAHDIKICSSRTNQQLENLQKEIIELIKKIETTQEFPPEISKLCDWCEYKSICPAWNSEEKIKQSLEKLKTNSFYKKTNSNYKKYKREHQSSLDKFPTIKKYVREE